MKTYPSTCLILLAMLPSMGADSPIAKDIKLLGEQRDKAVAAAVAPINKRYREELEKLLKKAVQASALGDAMVIRELIAGLETPAAPSTASAKTTKRKLDKTEWLGDKKIYFVKLVFEDDKLKWFNNADINSLAKYEVAEDGTLQFHVGNEDWIATIAADFKTLTIRDSVFTRK